MNKFMLLDMCLSTFEDVDANAAADTTTNVTDNADVTGAVETGGDAPHNDEAEKKEEPIDYDSKFEEMLADENYKKVYNDRVKSQIDRRSKKFREIQEQNTKYDSTIKMAYKKYNVDNLESLMGKLEEEHIENIAMNEGMPIEAAKNQYEQSKKLEEFERKEMEIRRESTQRELIGKLEAQHEKMKNNPLFADIDYDESLSNQDFIDKLAAVDYDLESAYRLHYFEKIIENKAKAVKDNITTNVNKRSNRPGENGTQDRASVNFKRKSFSDMSIEEMNEWADKN